MKVNRPFGRTEESKMADGSTVPVGVLGSGRATATRPGGLQRFARRRSTIGFLLALPLILLIGGLVVYPAVYAV